MHRASRIALLLLLCLALAGCSRPYTPSPPPWVVEQLRLSPNGQPHPGLLIREDGSGLIEVEPAGAEPLYLLVWNPSYPTANPPLPVPPGYNVLAKLEGQQIYRWDASLAEGQRWVKSAEPAPFRIDLENLASYARDHQHYASPVGTERPALFIPPGAQQLTILVILGQTLAEIPVELSYVPNPNFDRMAEEYERYLAAQRTQKITLLGLLACLGLGALLTIYAIGLVLLSVGRWIGRHIGGRTQPPSHGQRLSVTAAPADDEPVSLAGMLVLGLCIVLIASGGLKVVLVGVVGYVLLQRLHAAFRRGSTEQRADIMADLLARALVRGVPSEAARRAEDESAGRRRG